MGVSGVILAAGGSKRLGRPKQLLTLDGESIIRIVVRNAIESRLSETLLVTGAHADEVTVAVAGLGISTIYNPDFEAGQSTSLRAGLAAVDPGSNAVLFLLGDQPEVGADVIDAVIDMFERTGAAIVRPVYGSTPANPVLFARSLFPELMRVTGDEGARAILKSRAKDVLTVKVSDGPPPADVDTDADYQALAARWARRKDLDR